MATWTRDELDKSGATGGCRALPNGAALDSQIWAGEFARVGRPSPSEPPYTRMSAPAVDHGLRAGPYEACDRTGCRRLAGSAKSAANTSYGTVARRGYSNDSPEKMLRFIFVSAEDNGESSKILAEGDMAKTAADILLTFPPRPLSPTEHALVQEWLGLAGDMQLAFVSQRRSDDPRFFGRVVLATGPDTKPSHTIHAPAGSALWLVTLMDPPQRVRQFDSLRDALNSLRPVLT